MRQLYALALGTFAVGTEGFMIAAILPSISADLSTSIEATGQLVTTFALVYALSSPVLTALTASYPRRRLLMLSLTGFALANLVAAVAPGYWYLLGARVLLALAAGLYVPNANALAGSLAPAGSRGKALAIVNGGIMLAVAIGVPLGALVGTHLGWRMTFVGVACLSALALAVLAAGLPHSIAGSPPAGLRERLAVVAHPGALPTLLTTTLWGMATYCVYTYVSPFLAEAAGVGSEGVSILLFLIGCSALLGITLAGHSNDRFGARAVQRVSLPLMAVALGGLSTAACLMAPHALVVMVPLLFLWGTSGWAFFPPQQARLMEVVGAHHAPVILSLNASFMYLGFSSGSLLGSIVIASTAVDRVGFAAATCILIAMVVSRFAWGRSAKSEPKAG